MSHPLIEFLELIVDDGYSPRAISARNHELHTWTIEVSLDNWVPHGEGGDLPHHTLHIERAAVPKDVTLQGGERCEDRCLILQAHEEQMEAMFLDAATYGQAIDIRITDYGAYKSMIAKLNRWMPRFRPARIPSSPKIIRRKD